MARKDNMEWEWLLLSILSDDSGRIGHSLREIYIAIEEVHADILREGSHVVNPALLEVNLKHGDRPKYTHSVRSYLTKYVKAGLVERVARGTYRITDNGRATLLAHQGQ